ncbi:MAG TPA: hypothetical protein VF635_09585 [Propionibacteriaceae bacterium]
MNDHDHMAHDHTREVADVVGLPLATTDLGGGLVAAEAILGDGTRTFWLIDSGQPAKGVWNARNAPHELDGPLPRQWKQRVGMTCAATRTNGKPCANLVKHPGDCCSRHRQADV